MKLSPIVLSILMVAPVLAAIGFRKDFWFLWFQFCINFAFEMVTVSLENKEYFLYATIANMVLATIGYRFSVLYFLVFTWQAIFTYLRMNEILPFPNGYFALSNSLILCSIVISRFIIGRDSERFSGEQR